MRKRTNFTASRSEFSEHEFLPVHPGLLVAGGVVLQQQVIFVHQLLQLPLVGQAVWVAILVPALTITLMFLTQVMMCRMASLVTKQALSDITIKILFLPACCMDDCSQGNLTGSIDHAGISKEDRVKEGLELSTLTTVLMVEGTS